MFTPVDEDSIATVLSTVLPSKYKFQSEGADRKWSDLSKYNRAFDVTKMMTDLAAADYRTFRALPKGELAAAASADSIRFQVALRKILARLHDDLAKAPKVEWVRVVRNYFQPYAVEIEDANFEYFLSTLDLLEITLDGGILSAVAGDIDPRDVAGLLRQQGAKYASGSVASQMALANIQGKTSSLFDRDEASRYFASIRDLDGGDLVRDFYIDMGALSYYSSSDVASEIASGSSTDVRSSIVPYSLSSTRNELGIVVSVDPGFFRIYSHLIYFYAQQLPHIDFNFLVCGTVEETEQLIASGVLFLDALNGLNRSGRPSNISFYRVPVPGFAVEPKTFFACARFYSVQLMLERYPRLYLMDIDLCFDDDPTAFFKRVADLPVAAPMNPGVTYLSPWRRFLAGNMPFNRAILDRPFLEDLQDYVTHGLKSPNSWMLDQNALTYAIERSFSDDEVSLNRFTRPIRPPKFRSVWEKNYIQSVQQTCK